MTASLLATKYYRPAPAPDLVPRPHLTQRLNAGIHSRLILLSAPAGFGKTSLLASWLAERMNDESRRMKPSSAVRFDPSSFILHPLSFAWLSLDQSDTTLARFWAYVIAALQTAAPQVGAVAQAALQAPQPPPITTVLTALINDLVTLAQPLTLVLDDYHLITNPAIHHSLDDLLSHLPSQLRLVIATREDPPLALARLRARGQLTEIRGDDLRFSTAEAGAFLNDARALALTPEDVARLAERAEGWITGLRLAALSLQQANDRHGFIAAFSASHRFVADYLVDEVLARLDPGLQRFLCRTAILRRLCAPLCDHILSEPGSQQRLAQIEQGNLFLVPLDHTRYWYRYHHLFAEFLRLHLRTTEPDLVPALYQRAIAWCRAQGLLREALDYALDAADDDQAAEVIEALAAEVISHEGPEAVLQWVAALPAPLVARRPLLCCAYAWALTFAGQMADADAYLMAAEAASGAADAPTQLAVRGQVAAHRAYLRFFQGAFAEAEALAAQAMADLPLDDLVLRTRTALVRCGVLRFAGRLRAAEEALAPLADAVQATRNVYLATLYASSLGALRHQQGRLHQTFATLRQVLAMAEPHTGGTDNPFTGIIHIAIGNVRREWRDRDAAAASITNGVRLCRAWQQTDALAIGLVSLAELRQERGEEALAQQTVDELQQTVARMASPWGKAMADTCQARLDLTHGDLACAQRWAQASGLSIHNLPSGERLGDQLLLAQVLVARGDHADALIVLDTMVSQLRATGQINPLMAALVWSARALAGQGRDAEAREALAEALALGQPEGYVQTFIAGGPPIAELLRRMKDEGGRMQEYLARLLAAFPEQSALSPAPKSQPSALSPQPLNDRELAILRLMAAGQANRAIGDALYLSVNTVRWYASQIFAKLGVSGRGAAVARARELGLL
jgi:LuxR family transcriptional regulator, maltose regulon positive regulatory protein